MRAFPGWFEYNSVYALFPFTIPSENGKILKSLNLFSEYSLNPPKKPKTSIVFSSAANAEKILGDQTTFKVIWGDAIFRLSGGVQFMLSGDGPANTIQRKAVIKALYTDVPQGMDEVWDFYVQNMDKLLKERSYPIGDFYQVDAVREYLCVDIID